MGAPRPLNLQNKDDIQGRINDSQSKAINFLLNNPLASCLLLTNVSLTTGVNKIPHGLGRRYLGWFPSNSQAAADLFTSPGNSDTDRTIWIDSSANLVTDILVF